MTEKERLEIIEARRKYQRDYHRAWRAAHKENVKAINARFYAKKKEEYAKQALSNQGGEVNKNEVN